MVSFFEQFLANKLSEAGIDSDVYSPYICSILKNENGANDDETKPTLVEIFEQFDISDVEEFVDDIMKSFGELKDSNGTAAENLFLIQEVTPPPQETQTEVTELTERSSRQDFNDYGEIPEEDIALEEEQDLQECLYDRYNDWIELIDHVDGALRTRQPLREPISPDAIACALYTTNNNVEDSISLLFKTIQVAHSCQPCRHALTSRCLRSDCLFEHDLRKVPCKFWLFGVCMKHQESESASNGKFSFDSCCPFMHGLVSNTSTQMQSLPCAVDDDLNFPSLPSAILSPPPAGSSSKAKAVANYKQAIYRSYVPPTSAALSSLSIPRGSNRRSHSSSNNQHQNEFRNASYTASLPFEWVESGTIYRSHMYSISLSFPTLHVLLSEQVKLLEKRTNLFAQGRLSLHAHGTAYSKKPPAPTYCMCPLHSKYSL